MTFQGTRFGKGKGKSVFCKLSPNHKALHYGDWNEENTVPTLEKLSSKLPVSELKDLITGPSCPHVRDGNRRNRERNADSLAFSIVKENGDTLDFIAPNPKTFDYWCDGLSCLLRKEMKSNKAVEDIEMLLSMEVKIRLLDVEGIEIPDEPPPIPPLPPNFDFGQHEKA